MIRKFALSALAFSTLLIARSASAEELKRYLWNDEKGFVSAESCQEKTAVAVPLHVSTQKPARVIGGALHGIAAGDMEAYVMEVARTVESPRIGEPAERVSGSFWQAEMRGDDYVVLECAGVRPARAMWVLFKVFSPRTTLPFAFVGVEATNLAIFKRAKIHSPENAESALEERSGKTHDFHAAPADGASATHETDETQAPATSPTPRATAPAPGPVDLPGTGSSATQSTSPAKGAGQAPAGAAEGGAAGAAATGADGLPSIERVSGPLEYVICVGEGSVNVRDKRLQTTLFNAAKLEELKPVQSWGEEKQSKVVNGRRYSFIQVRFSKRPASANTGWVAEEFVKLKSKCAFAATAPSRPVPQPLGLVISGLGDPKCCLFPTAKRPTHSYREGMRRFRAGRDGGRRLHAAADLYREKSDPVLAVAQGTVIRGLYAFYQGTYAIEVRHSGGFIVRYGEVTGQRPDEVGQGSRVRAGQTVGFVGKVNSGCCLPMLHFEMYDGRGGTDSLNSGRAPFFRRFDLIDPTNHLRKWEKAKFGESY